MGCTVGAGDDFSREYAVQLTPSGASILAGERMPRNTTVGFVGSIAKAFGDGVGASALDHGVQHARRLRVARVADVSTEARARTNSAIFCPAVTHAEGLLERSRGRPAAPRLGWARTTARCPRRSRSRWRSTRASSPPAPRRLDA